MIEKITRFSDTRTEMSVYAEALSHPARVSILEKLAENGEATCGEMTSELPLAQSTVSQHLKKLLSAGFINCKKDGLKSIYSLNHNVIQRYRTLSFELLNILSNPLS